jgi:hypothetical protein
LLQHPNELFQREFSLLTAILMDAGRSATIFV